MAKQEYDIEILKKYRDDFLYYAPRCLTITDAGGKVMKFEPTFAQRFVHEQIEKQRRETGMVRAIILKGRQMGVSTYCEARALHKSQYHNNYSIAIIANDTETSRHVYGMMREMYANIPEWMPKPENDRNNYQHMIFTNKSQFKTLSAQSEDAGRGMTIQFLHGSEVAAWKFEEQICNALLPAIHARPETEIILESTPRGPQGLFYRMAMNAHEGKSDYILVFLPWFWEPWHAQKPPQGWQVPERDLDYQQSNRRQDGSPLTDEQMYFRHLRILNMGSVQRFAQEFPATVEEAFKADVDGALWTREDIQKTSKPPEEFKRVVIGVDPATTAKKNSDSTGIVLAGLGMDDKVYVLRDASGKHKVEAWANRVIEMYHEYGASKIVAESNQGGDMVTHAIRSVDPTANVVGKHVSISKVARHEPVAGMYRQGKVIHAEGLDTMEDQMCSWNPITHPKESPDRVDALTLAVGELLLGLKRKPFLL